MHDSGEHAPPSLPSTMSVWQWPPSQRTAPVLETHGVYMHAVNILQRLVDFWAGACGMCRHSHMPWSMRACMAAYCKHAGQAVLGG